MNDDLRIASLSELADAHLDNTSGMDTFGPAILALFDRWHEQLIGERDESDRQADGQALALVAEHRARISHEAEIDRLRGELSSLADDYTDMEQSGQNDINAIKGQRDRLRLEMSHRVDLWLTAESDARKAQAAIARVRKLCEGPDYTLYHMVGRDRVLRALDGAE